MPVIYLDRFSDTFRDTFGVPITTSTAAAPPVERRAVWTWHTSGPSGRELTRARQRQITARLRSPSDATFTINGRHEEAEDIDELVTDLIVRRDVTIVYRGRVGATSDTIDAAGHLTQVTTGDYRAILGRRILYDDDTLEWFATDKATIAWQLVEQTQTRTAGDLGITDGTTALGVDVDRDWEAGASIGEAIQELSEEGDGFDWDINPATLALEVWAERGSNHGVVLDLGGPLVESVHRTVDPAAYANAIRVNGDPALLDIETLEAADLATRLEGRWDAQHGDTTIRDAVTLAERAAWRLNEAQTIQPAYTVTLRRGRWEGPGHIWLGDTCRLVVRSGRLATNTLLRVYEISIGLDDHGAETVTLTLGAPRRVDLRRQVADQQRRLDQLERA